MRSISTIAALLLAGAASAQTPVPTTALPGVWSVGDAKRCDGGPAWVFLADGYYVEVQLPAGPASALGTWRDEGSAIAYTHTHLPFAGLEGPMPVRHLAVTARTADRIAAISPRGVARVFHRCPAGVLKAPVGGKAH